MAREPFIPEEFYAELDNLGITKVDQMLAAGKWGKVGPKFELAQAWRRAATEAEQQRRTPCLRPERAATAAERAASAAEQSAETAERALAVAKAANTRATIAQIIAATGAIAAIAAVIVPVLLRPS